MNTETLEGKNQSDVCLVISLSQFSIHIEHTWFPFSFASIPSADSDLPQQEQEGPASAESEGCAGGARGKAQGGWGTGLRR